jgi:hypothetical protein
MKKTFAKIVSLGGVVLLASACSKIPGEAYFNRGSPESLLDISSEVVTVQLESDQSIQELTSWISNDQPSRAEINCPGADYICNEAEMALQQFGVPATRVPSDSRMVTLVYERVIARDCENRYIDNPHNPYNLNHPTFGCSTAANMTQMISDKSQIVSPQLLDYFDGSKGTQVYNSYMAPADTAGGLGQASLIDE